MAGVPTNAGGDPVDEALAPARALDDEGPGAVAHDGVDRLPLAVAERRPGTEHRLEVALDRVDGELGGGRHGNEATRSLREGDP